MPKSKQLLTTQEFGKEAGVSAATVSKWIKSGKIKGKKEGNKWMIAASELKKAGKTKLAAPKKTAPKKAKAKATPAKKKPATSAAKPKPAAKPAAATAGSKSYSVEEFSDMTYLTVFGVEKWFKEGRLSGGVDASGQKRIDAANLENPMVKRLVR